MSLPNGGSGEEVIRTKAFEDYIRDHVVSWFTWAQNKKLGVGKMEDLILVSGCTLVTSWAAATFMDDTMEAKCSLANRPLDNGETNFVWSNKMGPVMCHSSQLEFDPVRSLIHIYSTYTDFFLCCSERIIHPLLRINVSSSRVSEQSANSSSNASVLQQDPVQITLTIAETMKYK